MTDRSPALPLAAAAFALSLAGAQAHAHSPLSPRFEQDTYGALIAGLARLDFPEVGRNSIVIAMTQALGLEAHDATVDYDEPYPQLPKVHVVATKAAGACADLVADVRYTSRPAHEVHITGTYCAIDKGLWKAKKQTVAGPK